MKIPKAIVLGCITCKGEKIYACIKVRDDNVFYCDGCIERKDCQILAGEVDVDKMKGFCLSCREGKKDKIISWWKTAGKKEVARARRKRMLKTKKAKANV